MIVYDLLELFHHPRLSVSLSAPITPITQLCKTERHPKWWQSKRQRHSLDWIDIICMVIIQAYWIKFSVSETRSPTDYWLSPIPMCRTKDCHQLRMIENFSRCGLQLFGKCRGTKVKRKGAQEAQSTWAVQTTKICGILVQTTEVKYLVFVFKVVVIYKSKPVIPVASGRCAVCLLS